MNQVLKSLEEITTGYSVFEKDQVLTHDQLNSVADYFDDQTRLTRVKLLGVGIVCGLRVTQQDATITISKGAGVTTDGDLLFIGAGTVFDKFKLYDESNPAYAPFYLEDTMIKVYELVPKDTDDARAATLDQFATQTGTALNTMAAVLFMEAYVKDEDLCSGTDCDNLGQDCVNNIKLLLIEKSSVGRLKQSIPTPNDASKALAEIVADRPLFGSGVATAAQIAAVYRATCSSIHGKLAAALPQLFPNCSPFLGDLFTTDPAAGWISRLNAFKAAFAADTGIQYYYDFLKDLVETWNAFRNELFGDTTWCCPDIDAFPKHLLLGNLAPATDSDENRTGFYPSPMVSRTAGQIAHAKLLAQKLDALIQAFQAPPAVTSTIRVTPSSQEHEPLENRAIPYYYAVNETKPVHKSWSYERHRRGTDTGNYSYNASLYGAQGAAANPLSAQIGRFDFFRVEGHLGQDVTTVVNWLEAEIKSKNLPFGVRSILADPDKTKVVKKPGIRYTDLNRFHYLLRQDAAFQLDDVTQFSGGFKQQVDDAVATNVVTNSPADNDGIAVKDVAAEKHSTVTTKAASARGKLNLSYTAYKADTSWQSDLGDTMKAAGEFKSNLGKVVKTDFNTPFDSLIGNSHILWLNWLDDIIKQKDDAADNKLLFSKFVAEHPGIEHFAGVPRGGTFVLVYDSSNKVVADFALDCCLCEETEEQPEEPPLTKPPWKPGYVVAGGIKINPSIEKFVTGKLDTFTTAVIDPKINVQQDYFNYFKDFTSTFTDVIGVKTGGVTTGTTGGIKFTDPLLEASVKETDAKQAKLDALREKSIDPAETQASRDAFAAQAVVAEAELAQSAAATAKIVSDGGFDISTGSQGYSAMLSVSKGVGSISDSTAKTTAISGLNNVKGATGNTALQGMIGSIVKM